MPFRCGVVLSGLTGAGKSTLQHALLEYGCWTPHMLTSRDVDQIESELVEHAPWAELVSRIRSGDAVAPMLFGGNLYAWLSRDFQRLQTAPAGAVLNLRPYTALFLSAAIPDLIPVWLDLAEEERHQRLAKRGRIRDQNSPLRQSRLEQDSEDIPYCDLFPVHILSDDQALGRLVELVEGKRTAHLRK